MSELDFDELDKAVNTLMSDVPKSEPPKTDDVTTLNIDATLPDNSKPSSAPLDTALNKTATPAAPQKETETVTIPERSASTSSASLATRRGGGRFMDVVHPSSDMKNATKQATKASSRQGVTIEPAKSATAADTASSVDDGKDTPEVSQNDVAKTVDQQSDVAPTPKAVTEPAKPVAPVAAHQSHVDEPATSSNDWPDPLDMANQTTDSTPAADNTPTDKPSSAEPEPTISDAKPTTPAAPLTTVSATDEPADKTDNSDDPAPLSSPFLTDAKVEKRPLGGALTTSDSSAESADHVEPTTDPENQLPATPPEETPLPPELHSDLMAIETDGGTSPVAEQPTADTNTEAATATDATPKTSEDTPKPTPSQPVPVATPEQPGPEVEKPTMPQPATTAEVSAKTAAAGPTSIVQQYREQPSTGEPENGAIYDTDSYHQPIAHPTKKKSDWLWIVWILLIIALGGGGAAALYFLNII